MKRSVQRLIEPIYRPRVLAPRPARILIQRRNDIVPIDLANIERIQGADDYATIVTTTKEYLASVRLADLESRLAGANFVRIHRCHLVNLDYVHSIEGRGRGRFVVALKSGTRLNASLSGSRRLRKCAL